MPHAFLRYDAHMSTSAADLAIDLTGVSKTYAGAFGLGKQIQALRGIDMRVVKGEVFGLLGPNGAGKSTLVKILMTVIRPTHCQGHLLGRPVGLKDTLRRVGYLPEHHKFPDYLTGAQVLDYFAALADVPRSDRRKRGPELLELVGMGRWGSTPIRKYSKGMRQRLGVAQALMNDPDLVMLDEPTDGVDPVGRRDIRNVLTELKNRGKTVFVNSHLLSELEMVCDRVAILVKGVVAQQGTIAQLTKGQERYEIELEPTPGQNADTALSGIWAAPTEIAESELDQPSLLQRVETLGNTITIPCADAARVQPILDALRAKGKVIRSFRPVRPSLEDLFMQAIIDPNTGEELDSGAGSGKGGSQAKPRNGGAR